MGLFRMTSMGQQQHHQIELETIELNQIVPPSLYKVILLNDDFTPMDFVIVVLQEFFAMNEERATQVMLTVHHEGRGVCGIYSEDIAATKVEQVLAFAREHQHPLSCVMEEA